MEFKGTWKTVGADTPPLVVRRPSHDPRLGWKLPTASFRLSTGRYDRRASPALRSACLYGSRGEITRIADSHAE